MTLLGLLATLLRHVRTIVLITVGLAVLAVAYVLLRPRTYTTAFSFLPQVTTDPGRAGIAGLAGQLGLAIPSGAGQSESPQMYADLLTTHEVLGPIATDSFVSDGGSPERVPLADLLEVPPASREEREIRTVRALRSEVVSISVATRTTGTITVRVRTRSPRLSQQLAERLLLGLNNYNVVTRQSQAGEERTFIEQRLGEAQVTLRQAEDRLERFLRSNRQFQNSPELSFARDRLQRDLNLQQQIVSDLAQQFEAARIREVRDIPVITLVDRPRQAVLPDPRGGLRILLGAVFAGLLLGGTWAVLSDELRRVRADGIDDYVALRNAWNHALGRRG